MFYMISYVIVAGGAFGMILLLARQGFEADKLVDFKGLNARSPWFAGMMAILMFSLAGVPPFIGFWAKLGVVQAVLGVELHLARRRSRAVLGGGRVLYLRMVKLMYFDEPTDDTQIGGSTLMRTVLSANALLAFALGVVPGALIALCQQALRVGRAHQRASFGLALHWRGTRYNERLFRCGVEQSGSSSGS